jgi:uncharacterized protein
MIVDCHTHWGVPFSKRDGADPTRWLEVLDNAGVTHAIVLPTAGLFGRVEPDNREIADVCAKSGGRMVPFCTVNTWWGDTAMAELEHCLKSLHFRGVKFHPWVQGLSVSTPEMDDVCDLAGSFGVPMLFHDGTPPFSLPSQMALLAQRHPKTQIILGHCGLFEHWREAIAALNSTPNLWGCLCSPHTEALRQLVKRCDRDRLVWGSDHGFTLDNFYEYRLGLMERIGLHDADKQAIFDANPRRLLRI